MMDSSSGDERMMGDDASHDDVEKTRARFDSLCCVASREGNILAPTELMPAITGERSILVVWTDNNPRVPRETSTQRFLLERSAGKGACFEQVGSTGRTHFDDKGLQPDTSYIYRVRAMAVSGEKSPYSAERKTSTLPVLKPIEIPKEPACPFDITGVRSSFDQVLLQWQCDKDNVQGFQISRSTDGIDWAESGIVGPAERSFTEKVDWKTTSKYYYWVSSFNKGRYSPVIYVISVTSEDDYVIVR